MKVSTTTVNPATEAVVNNPETVDFAQIKKELEKFGLSKNQSEIYLLLVSRGELRIQEIVKFSGVPRSSVYESLKALYELGIAEEIVGNSFKKVRAYSVGVMRHGIDEKIIHLKKLTLDLDNLEKTLKINPANSSVHSTTLRYYNKRSGARQILWNSLKAHSTVYVYSDWSRNRYVGMKFYEKFVIESRERNIRERVLINLDTSTFESIKKHNYPGSPITRTKIEDIRVLDRKDIDIKGDTFIYDNIYAQIYLKNVEINGFEIESRQFTATQRSIFETLWRLAKPLPPILSEVSKSR